jgi:hypothetical protein
VESQFIKHLADNLNAEIVAGIFSFWQHHGLWYLSQALCFILGTVQNVKEAVQWLSYTYLYIRMRQNPSLYGITAEEIAEDKVLLNCLICSHVPAHCSNLDLLSLDSLSELLSLFSLAVIVS